MRFCLYVLRRNQSLLSTGAVTVCHPTSGLKKLGICLTTLFLWWIYRRECFGVITTKLSRVGTVYIHTIYLTYRLYTWQSWQANCTPCPMPRQAILLLHPELCCRGQSALQLPHISDWICTQTIALWIVLLTGFRHTPWHKCILQEVVYDVYIYKYIYIYNMNISMYTYI